MKRLSTRLLAGAAALLVLATGPSLRAQESGIPVGSAAPVVTVDGVDGKPVSLDRYIGQGPVLIEFWATWCPNCKELEPKLQAIRAKYGSRIKLVGVAVAVQQSPQRVKLYAEKHALPVEVFYDRTGAAAEAYDVPATSYIVVLDRTGKVVYTGLGGDQDLEAAVRKAL
ncbi:MAG TPA: TlpA disulfide reductase family protein [Gemmatimonadaceae bacterium]|nr:TlpA disulfide reductase family protein [Gemmatimonadaceae bacterium]